MALTSARFRNSSRLQAAANNSPALRQGERNDAVGALQVALRDLGRPMPVSFAVAFPDGIFGVETLTQLKQFQAAQGLTADGVAGRDTLTRLDELFRGEADNVLPPFPQPDIHKVLYLSPPGPITPPDVPPLPLAQPGFFADQTFAPRFKLASFTDTAPSSGSTTSTTGANPTPTSPIKIGERTVKNNCGDPTTDDFKADDHPTPGKLPALQQASLNFLRKQSPLVLQLLWRTTFDDLYHTGPLGQSMITRFLSGSGAQFDHAVGSDLSEVAKKTQTFKNSNQAVKAEIETQFAAQFAADGDVDVGKLKIGVNIPFSTFSPDVTIPFKFRAMIGGIHGITLFATSFTKTGVGSYTMTLLYKICDNFGVGNDDLYTPDLQAMWILQHETKGPRPFVNSIEIEETISGTFTTVF